MAGRVDQDHGVAVGEVFGLGGPHRSRHQEAGPKEDDGSFASDPHMQPTEAALEVSVLQCGAAHAQQASGCGRLTGKIYRMWT
ncbi:Uncharacterised protein [Mycobacteroides abscessus subsp. abscessus]|nr:Uncharacterised protein [Mycobacteroides abscessus subsp. abscessus]